MEKIKKVLDKQRALNHMLALTQWDLETEAPKMALNRASKTLESISELSYNMVVNDEFKKMIYDIDVEKLNEIDKKLI